MSVTFTVTGDTAEEALAALRAVFERVTVPAPNRARSKPPGENPPVSTVTGEAGSTPAPSSAPASAPTPAPSSPPAPAAKVKTSDELRSEIRAVLEPHLTGGRKASVNELVARFSPEGRLSGCPDEKLQELLDAAKLL